MRRDVQEVFRSTPHHKQVMMFSATLSKEIRPVCRKFMNNVSIIPFLRSIRAGAVAARFEPFTKAPVGSSREIAVMSG